MIKQVKLRIYLPTEVRKAIRKMRPYKGGDWDRTEEDVKTFKRIVRAQLEACQEGKCAYCGLRLGETSRDELEHVAPKGGAIRPKHVEWTFETLNLVLSCVLCNSPKMKGTKETISVKSPRYSACQFKIVHPRFDDPNKHFDWSDVGKKILISAKSSKGTESIEMFKLDSTLRSEARAKQVLFDSLPDDEVNQIIAISSYRIP